MEYVGEEQPQEPACFELENTGWGLNVASALGSRYCCPSETAASNRAWPGDPKVTTPVVQTSEQRSTNHRRRMLLSSSIVLGRTEVLPHCL